MTDIEIGLGKSGRRAYALDEVAVVPSRRTRDPESVDLGWEIDAFRFGLPVLGAACDSVTSPATATHLAELGGAGILHAEGLWTRYDDPDAILDEIAALSEDEATARLQEIYSEPVKPELVRERIEQLKAAGVTSAVAVTPQRTAELAEQILKAEPDLLVIQATIVSAEHVSRVVEPLNLKSFIRRFEIPVIVGGCTSYQAALHLMRTGAAGVLVGAGSGTASTTRQVLGVGVPSATAIADARAARMRHLDETGVYVHVIADGGMTTGGDVAKAIVCGADAVVLGAPLAAATDAPGRGYHWGMPAVHAALPRGHRVAIERVGTLEEILLGPGHDGDGRRNLMGALRQTMALTGYETVKELQKAELVVVAR
ncbi:MAG: GuaB3 family IMP dehydrogenase-related protein [Acidimicrobiales bacterium]